MKIKLFTAACLIFTGISFLIFMWTCLPIPQYHISNIVSKGVQKCEAVRIVDEWTSAFGKIHKQNKEQYSVEEEGPGWN